MTLVELKELIRTLGFNDNCKIVLLVGKVGDNDYQVVNVDSDGKLVTVFNSMDFWSVSQEEISLTGVAVDKSLPSVTVVEIPSGATIIRAVTMFKFRTIESHTYAGVNKLNGAQEIQIKESVAGSYIDAINFVDDQFTLAQDIREGGDVIVGDIDVKAQVNGNNAYDLQWDEAVADEDGINFNDIQMGIRIWYSV